MFLSCLGKNNLTANASEALAIEESLTKLNSEISEIETHIGKSQHLSSNYSKQTVRFESSYLKGRVGKTNSSKMEKPLPKICKYICPVGK